LFMIRPPGGLALVIKGVDPHDHVIADELPVSQPGVDLPPVLTIRRVFNITN